ncbi:hypothetical protein M0804_003541 [Polistes exclamans]|nr:hypothetical protein M0804_003541 [Polistes exclamans]
MISKLEYCCVYYSKSEEDLEMEIQSIANFWRFDHYRVIQKIVCCILGDEARITQISKNFYIDLNFCKNEKEYEQNMTKNRRNRATQQYQHQYHHHHHHHHQQQQQQQQ